MQETKRAVVLSGGGTKGAYEIGVWRALNELSIDYHIVTGTSIGSINGALMTMQDYDLASRVWTNMVMQDFMEDKRTRKKSFLEFFTRLYHSSLTLLRE